MNDSISRRPGILVAILALAAIGRVHAGGSLLVGDASVTPMGRCQVESWAREFSTGQEVTTAPACNVSGIEFSTAASQFFNPSYGPLVNVGVKHVWRNFDQEPFGVGGSVGVAWSADSRRMALWSVNVPASFALDEQRNLVVHLNIGWLDTTDENHGLTSGVGFERTIGKHSSLMGELYAQHDGIRIAQIGWRRSLSENASLDFFVGHLHKAINGPWMATLGFNILIARR